MMYSIGIAVVHHWHALHARYITSRVEWLVRSVLMVLTHAAAIQVISSSVLSPYLGVNNHVLPADDFWQVKKSHNLVFSIQK